MRKHPAATRKTSSGTSISTATRGLKSSSNGNGHSGNGNHNHDNKPEPTGPRKFRRYLREVGACMTEWHKLIIEIAAAVGVMLWILKKV
jgi:hypothetical protein